MMNELQAISFNPIGMFTMSACVVYWGTVPYTGYDELFPVISISCNLILER